MEKKPSKASHEDFKCWSPQHHFRCFIKVYMTTSEIFRLFWYTNCQSCLSILRSLVRVVLASNVQKCGHSGLCFLWLVREQRSDTTFQNVCSFLLLSFLHFWLLTKSYSCWEYYFEVCYFCFCCIWLTLWSCDTLPASNTWWSNSDAGARIDRASRRREWTEGKHWKKRAQRSSPRRRASGASTQLQSWSVYNRVRFKKEIGKNTEAKR